MQPHTFELLSGINTAWSLLTVRKKMGESARSGATGCLETSALGTGEGEKVGQALGDGSSLVHTLHRLGLSAMCNVTQGRLWASRISKEVEGLPHPP